MPFETVIGIMQKTITRKTEIREIFEPAKVAYQSAQKTEFWRILESDILAHRVKFPLLEYVGQELYQLLPHEQQLALTDKIVQHDYEGGYVLVGIILQQRLELNLAESFSKAVDYFIIGDKWYVCDIISERVFGVALLTHFDDSYEHLAAYTSHPNDWVKRSVGIAIHYATKKGLDQKKVALLFDLTRQQLTNKTLHVKKGFGWALKTIAKFHPDIVTPFQQQILTDPEVEQWYKNKLKAGLKNSKT